MNKPNSRPLVSVSIIAYNHENRIARAIDSVLAQKVDFPIEVIVGDDHSKDATAEIIKKYEKEYPDLIFGIYHPRDYDEIPGRINNMTNLNACRGKYIAMLDGDDYWTDDKKLQKQVEFLEKHPEFHISFHDVRIVYEEVDEKARLFSETQPSLQRLKKVKSIEEIEFSDLLKYGSSMPTSSVVYLAEKIKPLPDWFVEVAAADYSLQLLAAEGGEIKYFKEVMGVYVKHGASVLENYFRSTENLENKIREVSIYKEHFREHFKEGYLSEVKCNTYFRLGKNYFQEGKYVSGILAMIRSIATDPEMSWERLLLGLKLKDPT